MVRQPHALCRSGSGAHRYATAKVEKAKQELAAGKGVREAARIAGISAASVSRLKNAMSVAAPTA